jgi:hypothetical protein
MTPENEQWRPLPDFEDRYEISESGRVRDRKTKKLKATYASGPYLYWKVSIWIGRPKMYTSVSIHRAVYRAFVGEPPPGMQVCHNDDIRSNNHYSNLRADTPKANQADRIKFGKVRRGVAGGNCKVTKEQVREIRAAYAAGGVQQKDLAKQYGVEPSQISCIVTRKSWAWVTEAA